MNFITYYFFLYYFIIFFYKYFFFKRRPPAQCEAPSRRARGRGSLTPPLSSTLTWLSWAVGVWARSGEPSWAASVIMWFIMLMYLLWCVRHLDFECGINSWLGICTCMWISPVFFFSYLTEYSGILVNELYTCLNWYFKKSNLIQTTFICFFYLFILLCNFTWR